MKNVNLTIDLKIETDWCKYLIIEIGRMIKENIKMNLEYRTKSIFIYLYASCLNENGINSFRYICARVWTLICCESLLICF